MPDVGLANARLRMEKEGIAPVAINAFSHAYRRLLSDGTGYIREDVIEPLAVSPLESSSVSDSEGADALGRTAVIKLNGGLGTSMGLDRAKSTLIARDGLTFLDIIARQVLAARAKHQVSLPLIFMNSFRTSDDTMTALARYPDLSAGITPIEIMQNKIPKLRADNLTPVEWPLDPSLEWCPPGHGDLYVVVHQSGLLDILLEHGFTQLFVSNADNLGAVADPLVAGWFAKSQAPIAIESVRRTLNDRKGGHLARRRSDGRIVLRETAQTTPEDMAALTDLGRHRFCSTNNLWLDIRALRDQLVAHDGSLPLPLIRNNKTVDPSDPRSTPVIQLECAMGAAIEVFPDGVSVEVNRARFVPVKTTEDLLLLGSDCYTLDADAHLQRIPDELPYVELGPAYRRIQDFNERFPDGLPSLRHARSLVARGDWLFEGAVTVVGGVVLGPEGGRVNAGAVLEA